MRDRSPQAWEIFFTTFVFLNYLYRPFFGNERYLGKLEQANQVGSSLDEAIRGFTFAPLRNTLIRTVVDRLHPATLHESEAAVPRIRSENFGQDLTRARIEAFPDPEVRGVLLRLQDLTIGALRNRVVHKDAYRPRLAEVERCRDDEIRTLYDTRHLLPVRTFEEWRATSRS